MAIKFEQKNVIIMSDNYTQSSLQVVCFWIILFLNVEEYQSTSACRTGLYPAEAVVISFDGSLRGKAVKAGVKMVVWSASALIVICKQPVHPCCMFSIVLENLISLNRCFTDSHCSITTYEDFFTVAWLYWWHVGTILHTCDWKTNAPAAASCLCNLTYLLS